MPSPPISHRADSALIDAIVAQRTHIAGLEQALWREPGDTRALTAYQAAYRELEALIARQGVDNRHSIVIVIPVADRPQQLQNCLESLVSLCQRFGYGGASARGYAKLSVLIADDSKEPANIKQHQKLVECKAYRKHERRCCRTEFRA